MDLMTVLTDVGPQWAGFIVAIYVLWKISSNALHGIAKSNEQIASTLQAIEIHLKEHSESDARIFTRIEQSLDEQVKTLIRLEERTRNG